MFDLRDPRRRAMAVSLAVALLMLAGKLAAYVLTGSAAIFSDAAESIIHVVATLFVGFSLWYALQPPDAGHPYGHGKVAYFASGFEGSLILIAGVTILVTAVRAWVEGSPLQRLDAGLGLLAALTLVNLVLGRYLIATGRRHHNLVLVSNGRHVLTDMWTSLGVLVGLALVWWTGEAWLDPLVAVFVALHIFGSGFLLVRQAVRGLMEKADAEDTRRIVEVLDEAVAAGRISAYHQLRHRRVHDQLWIEYHVLLPGSLTVADAHAEAHEVEEAVVARFGEESVFVTAHLEPDEHDAAHPDGHAEPDDPLSVVLG